jgi:hypothetical protein
MGGNCMVEKYLWNGRSIMILYTKDSMQISMLWLSKIKLQASWMRKSQLIWYKYNHDVLSLKS